MTYPSKTFTNTPPGWKEVDTLLGKYAEPSTFGFNVTPGDLNRFCSRYRLAKSFRSIALDRYAPETVEGYTSLFRVFLAYSAFEQFMRVVGTSLHDIAQNLAPYHPEVMANKIRAVPEYERYLLTVLQEVTSKHLSAQGYDFVNGKPCNVLVVPAIVRHIFAHGKLTPNSGARDTAVASAISPILCEFLFRVMDGQFLGRLRGNGVAV